MTEKTPLRIFLVESDKDRARRLARFLKVFGHVVRTAADSENAVRKYEADGNIDLILMDLDAGDGKTAIPLALKILKIRPAPIVFQSARCDPETWAQIESLPHYGCIQKETGDASLPSVLNTAFRLFVRHQTTRGEEERYRKRTAELSCLFRISELFGDGKRPLETVFPEIAAILPSCLNKPDAARARIVLEGREYAADGFEDTPWKISADIRVGGRNCGIVEIAYRLTEPEGEACFLQDERKILNFTAGRIGTFMDHLRAEADLRESEAFIRMVMDNLPIGVAVNSFDAAVDFLYVNENFRRIYRFPPDTPYRADAFWEAAYPDPEFREEIRKRVMEDIASGNPEQMAWHDIPLVRKGEKATHISAKNIAVPEKRLMISTVWDVTDRKEAEEKLREALHEKDVMLREIHHRVKNNMQVISSLLRLQAWRIPDKELQEVFQASQERIRSMALIHDKLYRSSSLTRIDFGEYARDLAGRLLSLTGAHDDGISAVVDIAGIELDIQQAIPCGLILNEIVCNSLKHAFPGGTAGTIWISMNRDSEGRMNLVIGDDGVGLPAGIDVRRPTTLGLQIVSDLVGQLDGTLSVNRSAGTVFTIVFN